VLEEFGEALGLAFQLSDDIMDLTATERELEKEPGQDLREGVFTLPVLYTLNSGSDGDELRELLASGRAERDGLARALEIVRSPESLAHARRAVVTEVDRAQGLARRLPSGAASFALDQLAEYLAARCDARGT
jgi:heptaprenyl diphosphate synthase